MQEGAGWGTQWGRLSSPRNLPCLSQVNTLEAVKALGDGELRPREGKRLTQTHTAS